MSIETGKYWIKPVGDDTALVGVDSDNEHVARVVVGGNDNVVSLLMFVQSQPRPYHFFLSFFCMV